MLFSNKSPLPCMMKGKPTLPNITPPNKMEVHELIYEFPDDTFPVVMEDCVNNEHKDSIREDLIEKMIQK